MSSSKLLKMGYEISGYQVNSTTTSSSSSSSLSSSGTNNSQPSTTLASFREISTEFKPYAPFLIINLSDNSKLSIVNDDSHKNSASGCQLIGSNCLPFDYEKLKNKSAVSNDEGNFYCGCSISKALLQQYCASYYSSYENLVEDLIKIAENKMLYCNVKFQVGQQNSQSMQFLVTDIFDSGSQMPFIGINAAAILSQSKDIIDVIISDGKSKTFLIDGENYFFKWDGYKNGIVTDYNSNVVDTYTNVGSDGFIKYVYKNKKNVNSSTVAIRPFLDIKDTSKIEELLNKKPYPSGKDELYEYDKSNVFASKQSISVVLNGERPPLVAQSELRKNTTVYGTANDTGNLVWVDVPYTLNYRWSPSNKIQCHKLVAPYVPMILQEVLDHYGLEKIKELGLDICSSSYRHTKVDGSNNWSVHAWGLAFDWDYYNNRMYYTSAVNRSKYKSQGTAKMSSSEYNAWFDIWAKYGGYSLGKTFDFDWMHLQFATFG